MNTRLKQAALLLGRMVKPVKVVKDDDQVQHISEIKKQSDKFKKFFKEGFSGKTGTRKKEVDPKQLAMGIKVEAEHCEDVNMRTKIALDHLTEIPDYYTRLKKLEDEAEADGVKQL